MDEPLPTECPLCDRRPGLDRSGRLVSHQRHMFTRTRCPGSGSRPLDLVGVS